jgi:hypothetical protein
MKKELSLIWLFLCAIGLNAADMEGWQKAWSLNGSPFKYCENSASYHGGPSFRNKNPEGLFSAIELNYFNYELAINLSPNPKFKALVTEIVNNFIREEWGIRYEFKNNRVVSVVLNDEKNRSYSIESDVQNLGYFSLRIGILPEIQETKCGYHDIPVTDYGATDVMAAVLNQMSTHEGPTFEENVYKFSLSKSRKTKHFVIRDNNLRTVGKFSELIESLYEKCR